MKSDKLLTVGFSNSTRTGTSTFELVRSRAPSRSASSECPPSAKKSSSTPTRSTPSSSPNSSTSSRSSSVSGARPPSPVRSGTGSALRSILPLGVSGNSGKNTTCCGTM
jgi:hypothetical protein